MTKQTLSAPASTGQEAPVTAQNITVRQRATMISRRRRQTAGASSSPNPSGAAAAASNVSPAPAAQPTSEAAAPPAAGTEPNPSATASPAQAGETSPQPTAGSATEAQANAQPAPGTETSVASESDPLAALQAESAPEGAPATPSSEAPGSEMEPERKMPEWMEQILEEARSADGKPLNKAVIKRMYQLWADLQQERATRTKLEQRVAQAAPAPEQAEPGPAAEGEPSNVINAFAWHPSIQKIDQELGDLNAWISWADDNAQGGVVRNKDGREEEFSAEHVRNARARWESRRSALDGYRAALTFQIQAEDSRKRQAARDEACRIYPWMKDPASPEYQEARQLLRDRPGLVNDPEWPLLVGDYITGRRLRGNRPAQAAAPTLAKPMQKPKGGHEPAPVVAASGAAPARVSPVQKSVQDAEAEYRRTGSVKAREKLFALKRRLQSEAA